jgi:hypothetical protein
MEQNIPIVCSLEEQSRIDNLPCETPAPINCEKERKSYSIENCHSLNRRLDLCDRIFESLLIDLKLLIVKHERFLTQKDFISDLEILLRNFKQFAKDGDIRQVIEKAEIVMLNSLTEDLCKPFDTDEETCHC